MAHYPNIPEKTINKWNEELIELHKRCIKTYLVQRSLKVKHRNFVFTLYSRSINHNNIRAYFYIPIKLFVQYLVQDRLDEIIQYIIRNEEKPKRKRKRVQR